MEQRASDELDRLPAWAPFIIMGVLTLLVFRQYLLSGPGEMLLGQDTIAAGIMFRKFFVEHIQALGRLPLWNPYLFGGVPTVEAGSGDILYPASILHFVLPLTSALAWKLIVHVYLAGVFMYLATRALGARRYPALFAGSAYMLSANLVSLVWGGQDGKMYVTALFPAGMWLLVTALNQRSWIRFLWLGVVAGLMVVAHPQLAYYAYIALAAYALGVLWSRRNEGGAILASRLAGSMLAVVAALGVAAVVLLPMYRYLREDSPRAGPGRGFEHAASWSLHAEEAAALFIPEFAGTDVQSETYWGKNPFKHNSEYGGALVLVLGVAAIAGLKGDRRRWGFAAMAAIALLYALGAGTPVFRALYSVVPGLKNFRAPSLATFVAVAALTFLAALLLDRGLSGKDPQATRAMSVSLLVGCVLALMIAAVSLAAGPGFYESWASIFGRAEFGDRSPAFAANQPRIVGGALLVSAICALSWLSVLLWSRGRLKASHVVLVLSGLTLLDLLRVDGRYIQIVRYDDFFPPDPGIEALRTRLAAGERVLTVGGVYPEGFLATYGIPEVFGYHGNQLRWYNALTRYDVRQTARTAADLEQYWLGLLNSGTLKALAARYVLLPGQVDLPGYRLLGADQRVAIYFNEAAAPGAAVVPEIRVEPDSARRVGMLWSPTFDPTKTVVVEQPVLAAGQAGGTGTAVIEGNGEDTLAVRARSSGPALLTISRTFHPSWEAAIDGRPVPVVRANHALMAVPLDRGGEHRVVLRYRPTIVRLAAAVTAATWLIVLLGTALGLALRRRQSRG
ncbi:MAG TPA: YfhO family protein [Gemmatimonadales bacterium]|nr:YfhO family protein [Gemmatimonadales bacterium]